MRQNVKLVSLFSPEHGIRGVLDQTDIADSVDEKTGLPIYSLYGKRRWPTKAQLEEIDALVFDVQDVGARYYTNTATMALSMKAAAEAGKEFFVLDRPDPIGGEIIEGPLLDGVKESFVGDSQHPDSIRADDRRAGEDVCEGAEARRQADRRADGRLAARHRICSTRIRPGPTRRRTCARCAAAVLYPGIGVMEYTNISVGRGTNTPFELLGAPWINERDLAYAVNAAKPPGVRVLPVRFTPTDSKFKGQECQRAEHRDHRLEGVQAV